jgi:hypothetical protein
MIVQAQPESLLHWLYTNAPAAWISALIAVSVLGIQLRKKPKRLVIRELRNTSLINIQRPLREKIKMTFADRPIQGLAQVEGEIFNEGSDTIQRARITLTFPLATALLDARVTPDDAGAQCDISDKTATITLPYLNSVRDHKQLLKISILADGDTGAIKASGGGEGWSTRYLALPTVTQQRKAIRANLVVSCAIFALLVLYLWWMGRYFDIGASEVSLRSALLGAPVVCVVAPILYWTYRLGRRQLRR